MSENEKRILEMLANTEISVDEAHRLLNALEPEAGRPRGVAGAEAKARSRGKYLRVKVAPGPGHEHDEDAELVNVRVPLSLVRAGMKFTSVLPVPPEVRERINGALREKGVNFDMRNLSPEELDELIEALSDLEVDVVSDREMVKVFVE
ncbi:MAG: hypothetical protein ACLFVD_06545 [Dehalococcoidia bacterium]